MIEKYNHEISGNKNCRIDVSDPLTGRIFDFYIFGTICGVYLSLNSDIPAKFADPEAMRSYCRQKKKERKELNQLSWLVGQLGLSGGPSYD